MNVGPTVSYAYPCFNPKNSQQFSYFKFDGEHPTETGVYIADLATGTRRIVRAGNDISLQLRWSATGWLAFNKADQIWKIKTNGDSIKQLSFGAPHYKPQWSPDGQQLVFREPDSPGAPLVRSDKQGNFSSRVATYPTIYCESWSPDGTKLLVEYGDYGKGYGLAVLELAANKTELIVVTEVAGNTSGLVYGGAWLPDSHTFVWSAGTGLYRTDMQTKKTQKLHAGCDTRIYLHPSVSADGTTILVNRIDKVASDNGNKVYSESNLWTMDGNGANEKKVAL